MADKNVVAEGELAAKLTSDVSGGLGTHKAGTVLRNLSTSAFNTITNGGFGDALEAGTEVSKDEEVDASAPISFAPPEPEKPAKAAKAPTGGAAT